MGVKRSFFYLVGGKLSAYNECNLNKKTKLGLASCAWAGLATFPVPIAHTGS